MQRFLKEMDDVLFVYVAYAGHSPEFQNRSPLRLIRVKSPQWSLLRQDLEQNCTEDDFPDFPRNRRTYIEGYSVVPFGSDAKQIVQLFQEEDFLGKKIGNVPELSKSCMEDDEVIQKPKRLKERDFHTHEAIEIETKKTDVYLQKAELLKTTSRLKPLDIVLLVRKPMPLGGRVQVPVQRNIAQLRLQEELQTLGTKSWNDLSDIRALMSQYDDSIALLKEDDPDTSKEARREKILDWMKRMTLTSGHHVSELKKTVHTLEAKQEDGRTWCEYEDVAVLPTYKCFECMQMGHHHHDACFLYEKQVREIAPIWGASKFKWKVIDEAN